MSLGGAMGGVAALALVLGILRVSAPLAIVVGAVLGVAARRVRAVRRVGAGTAGGAALWADSLVCAVLLVLTSGIAGFVGMVLTLRGVRLITGPIVGPGVILVMVPVGIGLGVATARVVARALWPGPDGQLAWSRFAGGLGTNPDRDARTEA
jgi:hypothetical protein